MRIIAKCPKCKNNWLLDNDVADKRLKCRKCGTLFKVPRLDEVRRAVALARKVNGPIYIDEDCNSYG